VSHLLELRCAGNRDFATNGALHFWCARRSLPTRIAMMRRRSSSRRRTTVDDLGLSVTDDPGSFARAFIAVTRRRDQPPIGHSVPAFAELPDELGFPMESNPADFARGFNVTWGRCGKDRGGQRA
jgi:hypothetical protein